MRILKSSPAEGADLEGNRRPVPAMGPTAMTSTRSKSRATPTWHKPIEDVYWRWNIDSRCPVYMEYLIHDRRNMEKIFEDTGF